VFDMLNRVEATVDALANRGTSVYDATGNRTVQIDARGYRTTFVFDELNRAYVTIDALNGRSTSTFDAAGNVRTTVDPLNRTTTFGYDALNRVSTTTDALAGVSTATYDAAGNVATRMDQLGRTTTFAYDALNRLVTTTDALGQVSTVAYDAAGNATARTDALGHTTTSVYDSLNRVEATVDPLGNRTTSVFDAAGRMTASVNALTYRTTYGYDPRGLVATVKDALGNVTTSTFDAAGNTVSVTNARGYTTTSVFDALNRPYATIDALGNRTTSVFDAAGNRTAVVDQLNNRTTAVYDELNRQIATVNALGNRTTVGYDAVGNVTTRTDALNKTTTLGYDALNRQTTEKDALGYTTTSVYDAVGNRTVLIDASGNRTTSVFDALNRVTTETNPQNVSGTFAYDAASRKTSETDRLGRRRDFGYDDADRVLTEKWYAAGGALTQTQTFSYDAVGQMLTAVDPDGAYTLAYDGVGRVTRADEPFSLVLTMGYDAVGNRTSVQDSKGGTATVAFDALNRQTSEQTAVSGGSAMRFDYAYTARSQVSSVTRYSDLAGTTVVGTTSYDYDAARRETHQQSTNGSGTVLANYTYTLDAADRVTDKVENGTTTTYGYDVTSQLTNDGVTTFGYDATGNRTNTGYATGTGNRMTSDGLWTWTYDNAGNVTKRSKGASSDTWEYTYDHRNQMLTAAFSATDGGTVTTRVTYTYDAWGNMIERAAWDGSTTTTVRHGVDGWDPAQPVPVGNEQFNAWAELDNSNNLTMRRAFGFSFDEVIARQTAGGTVLSYLTDRQGSVRQLIDNAGAIVGTIAYSAHGQVTLSSGTTDGYAYTGQNLDATTGFLIFNVRIYDPWTGKFLQQDTLGFAAGDPNLFRYVKNSPTNATDPSGNVIITETEDQAKEVRKYIVKVSGAELPEPHILPLNGRWVIEAVPPTDSRYDLLAKHAKATSDALSAKLIDQVIGLNRYNLLVAGMSNSGMNMYVRGETWLLYHPYPGGLPRELYPLINEPIPDPDLASVLAITPTDDSAQHFGWKPYGVGSLWSLANAVPITVKIYVFDHNNFTSDRYYGAFRIKTDAQISGDKIAIGKVGGGVGAVQPTTDGRASCIVATLPRFNSGISKSWAAVEVSSVDRSPRLGKPVARVTATASVVQPALGWITTKGTSATIKVTFDLFREGDRILLDKDSVTYSSPHWGRDKYKEFYDSTCDIDFSTADVYFGAIKIETPTGDVIKVSPGASANVTQS
jgi:RHS repeat-associated protein